MQERSDQPPEQHTPTQAQRVTALLLEAAQVRATYQTTRYRGAPTGNLTRGHGGNH